MQKADDLARQRGHGTIDAEHIVAAALSDPEHLASQAVQALGVPPDAVRRAVLGDLPAIRGRAPEQIPFTVRAKEALDARRIARRYGTHQVGPEHILLNVLVGRKGGAVLRTLKDFDITDREVAAWLDRHRHTAGR